MSSAPKISGKFDADARREAWRSMMLAFTFSLSADSCIFAALDSRDGAQIAVRGLAGILWVLTAALAQSMLFGDRLFVAREARRALSRERRVAVILGQVFSDQESAEAVQKRLFDAVPARIGGTVLAVAGCTLLGRFLPMPPPLILLALAAIAFGAVPEILLGGALCGSFAVLLATGAGKSFPIYLAVLAAVLGGITQVWFAELIQQRLRFCEEAWLRREFKAGTSPGNALLSAGLVATLVFWLMPEPDFSPKSSSRQNHPGPQHVTLAEARSRHPPPQLQSQAQPSPMQNGGSPQAAPPGEKAGSGPKVTAAESGADLKVTEGGRGPARPPDHSGKNEAKPDAKQLTQGNGSGGGSQSGRGSGSGSGIGSGIGSGTGSTGDGSQSSGKGSESLTGSAEKKNATANSRPVPGDRTASPGSEARPLEARTPASANSYRPPVRAPKKQSETPDEWRALTKWLFPALLGAALIGLLLAFKGGKKKQRNVTVRDPEKRPPTRAERKQARIKFEAEWRHLTQNSAGGGGDRAVLVIELYNAYLGLCERSGWPKPLPETADEFALRHIAERRRAGRDAQIVAFVYTEVFFGRKIPASAAVAAYTQSIARLANGMH